MAESMVTEPVYLDETAKENGKKVVGQCCLYSPSEIAVAAGAIAAALSAGALDFVSNVPGVLAGGELLPALTTVAAEALIADGTVTGGMIPKVRTALDALGRGVPRVRIVNLAGLSASGGTVFS